MNLLKIILVVIAIFIFSGCSSSNTPNNEVKNIPSWYLNAPNNNSLYLYGTGEGESLKESKDSALNNLASNLSVDISSEINSYKNSSTNSFGDSSYSKDISQEINIEVKKIKLSNVKVEKSTQIANSFFTLIKISRGALFNDRLGEFELLDNFINQKISALSSKSTIEQIKTLQELYPQLNQAKNDAFTLYTINNKFDYKTYVTKYDTNMNKIALLKDEIIINVSTNEESQFFSDKLIQLLNENSYKTSNRTFNTTITLSNDIRYSTARGWQIAKVTTTISTVSKGKKISSIIIDSVGRSSSTRQNALQSASIHFQKQLNELGLNTIIFN